MELRALCLFLWASAAVALEPVQVSKSVYFVRGETAVPSAGNRGHTSNAAFVVTTGGVVVFDALGTPVLGAQFREAIRRVTPLPVRRVIVSHYHADHFYGLAAFKDAEIWAQRAARAYLDSDAPKARLAERSRTLARWVPADMPFVRPTRYVDREESFRLGAHRFRVLPVGPAHTPEDLALLVEGEGILFVGDLMFNGRVPFVGEADSKSWIAATDRLVRLKPRVMIGGHGDVSRNAAADLRLTRDYLAYLRETMGRAADDWVDFDEAYAKTDWSRFSALPAFEAVNRRNAYNTYIRMQGGDR